MSGAGGKVGTIDADQREAANAGDGSHADLTAVMVAAPAPAPDPWHALRQHTPARIALGRSGASLPTAEVLRFAGAHAQARDAVHEALDVAALDLALRAAGWAPVVARSRAATRADFLRRPDLGRRLDEASAARLADLGALSDRAALADGADLADPADLVGMDAGRAAILPTPATAPLLVVVVADGLSARAAQSHALPTLQHLRTALDVAGDIRLRWGPVVIATQARVALADEIGALLGAALVLMLLGERPGLSSPDSLSGYLTFGPHIGRSDAERNCVSNIRPAGLSPPLAAARLAWLVREALRRRLSGVALKDDSAQALIGGSADTSPPGPARIGPIRPP